MPYSAEDFAFSPLASPYEVVRTGSVIALAPSSNGVHCSCVCDDCDVCDVCGKELVVRKDDAPETVKNRLKVFHAETEPLKDFYAKLGVLKLVEGNQPIESATKDILAALGE